MAEKKSTMYDLEAEKIREKIIIFAVDTGGYTQKEVSLEVQASLDELAELIDTAGGEVVGRLVQNRDKIANDLYLGRGKVEELRNMIYELGATGVCCDDELSPAQLMNLQDALRLWIEPWLYLIYLQRMQEAMKENFRWNLPSLSSGRPDL